MTGPFECKITAVGKNGGELKKKVCLPFKLEPGDVFSLDMQTHRWAAHYGDGRVIFFASHKRASDDVMQFGGSSGFVSDMKNPDHLKPATFFGAQIISGRGRKLAARVPGRVC